MTSIINKANSAAKSRDYDQALYILSEIPEEVPGYAGKVTPLMQNYYKNEIDMQGADVLNRANAAWAQSPNADGAQQVAEILQDMPTNCSSSNGAKKLVSQILTRVQNIDNREFAMKKEQMRYDHSERNQSIMAARAIGLAWAKNQPKQVTKVYLW